MLMIDHVTFRIGGRVLLDDASAVIAPGQKVSLVGRNGTGKTSLLKLIAGDTQTDGGTISYPSSWRMGRVKQETGDLGRSVLETVLDADTERTELLKQSETEQDGYKLGMIHERLLTIQAAAAPSRAASILAGLGFDTTAQAQPIRDFSGGWRMRVSLAGALFARPDLLILDEPTNHLDLESAMWLEEWLKRFTGTLLIVSHDRGLLTRIPEITLHLDNQKLTAWKGGYDRFSASRAEAAQRHAKAVVSSNAERLKLQAFVDRFRAKASKARQAQSRMKRLEKLGEAQEIPVDVPPRFDLPSPTELAPPLLVLDDITVGYGDKPVLHHINLRLDPDDRIALLGRNGNGKSTLIKLLAGRLQPMSGEIRRSGKMKIGYFAQHQGDELDLKLSALRQVMQMWPEAREEQARNLLGRYDFSGPRADTKVGDLSGGEKARLLFALATRTAPHILLLDEPTNHLDLDSRTALIKALNQYEGAVVLVSHDAELIEMVADRLLLIDGGTVTQYDGDLEEYAALVQKQGSGKNSDSETGTPKSDSRKDDRRARAEARLASAPLRKQIENCEKRISEITARLARIDAQMADSNFYEKPMSEQTDILKQRGQSETTLSQLEEQWLEFQSRLEDSSVA